MKKNKTIYLDHAAATPLDSGVFKKMKPYLTNLYANPGSIYSAAMNVKTEIANARKTIAEILAAQSNNIIFTSGGTESTNLAILGTLEKIEQSGRLNPHIITTAIEHPAVLEPIRALEKKGVVVTYLPVDENGNIFLQQFKQTLQKETVLVSIMYANNEIGIINPIAEIGREILKWRKQNKTEYPLFHTDACQAAGYLELNVDKLHVDLMSLNSSKIYGPKGAGLLYKRPAVEISPLIYGGGQEQNLRSGTPHVAGIVGLAKALSLVQAIKDKESIKIKGLRDFFWQEMKKTIKGIKLNGSEINRLPNNLNVVIPEIESDELIIYLDEAGIICSSGSACAAESNEASHVLAACGLSNEYAKRSIRFTLGKETTKQDLSSTVLSIKQILRLRAGKKFYE